jgi:hypothetical protein
MAFLVQGDSSTATNPVLDLYTSFDNILTDVYSLSFQIYDVSTDANRAAFNSNNPSTVQVYPTTPGTYFNLDVNHLTTDVPAGHKLSTGHYYAPWLVPTGSNLGNYIIAWYYQRTSISAQKTYQEEFVVIDTQIATIGSPLAAQLQMYMWDYFSANELIDRVEYSPQQYELAINLAVMRFNAVPFLTQYQALNFPPQALYVLFMGAAGHLLRSTSILQLRNQLTYMDGNIHVGITDKHSLYIAAGNMHLQEFDQMVRGVKNNLNNDDGWDTVDSPYAAPLGGYGNSGFGWGWG